MKHYHKNSHYSVFSGHESNSKNDTYLPKETKVVTAVFNSNDVVPCCTQIIGNKETTPLATNNGQTKEDLWKPSAED